MVQVASGDVTEQLKIENFPHHRKFHLWFYTTLFLSIAVL
jgi:hypothetical protein